jgi:hypothetical protein
MHDFSLLIPSIALKGRNFPFDQSCGGFFPTNGTEHNNAHFGLMQHACIQIDTEPNAAET